MEENINAIFYISSVNSICAYRKNTNISVVILHKAMN